MSESQLIEKRKKLEEEMTAIQARRNECLVQAKNLQAEVTKIDERANQIRGSYTTLTELIGDDPSKKNAPKAKEEVSKPVGKKKDETEEKKPSK